MTDLNEVKIMFSISQLSFRTLYTQLNLFRLKQISPLCEKSMYYLQIIDVLQLCSILCYGLDTVNRLTQHGLDIQRGTV